MALSYLRKLPVDVIRIDPLYIDKFGQNKGVDGILKALTGMAHDMNIRIEAEGIDSAEQLQLIKQLGYDRAQASFTGTTRKY